MAVIFGNDNFSLLPDALDSLSDRVCKVAQAHFSRVSRYTPSAFMRAKLDHAVRQRGVAPHTVKSTHGARQHLGGLARHPQALDPGATS